jgi:CRP/FNR family transcriptional regulator, transcriptional activator FtrB
VTALEIEAASRIPDLLRALPIFAEADTRTLRRIEAISSGRRLPAQAVLFRRGDTPDCLHVLLQGKIVLDAGIRDGDSAVVEVARPMSLLGLPPVLLRRPSLMTAQALEASEVLSIAAAPLHDLLEADARLGLVMLSSLAREYQTMVHQLAEMKRLTAAQRLGCYLLTLSHEQGGARELHLPCDKRTLASRLGATPEHLSRAFATLRERGVSTGHGRRVVLGDPERLAAFARPDELAGPAAPAAG